MKKRQSVALVSAGKLTDSPVTRFPALADFLGPVKAPSLRLASRAVNTLRAGYAVENWDHFQSCSLILISVPDEAVAAAVGELCASGQAWHNRAVVLCSTWLDGTALGPLARLGASVGSVMPVPGFDDQKYLLEGRDLVIQKMHKLLKRRGTSLITVEPPLKPFFLASMNCTGALFYSLLVTTAECLRQSSIPRAEAAAVMQRQFERTLRSYFVAGRNACPDLKELSPQLQALAMIQPEVAEYMEGMAKMASNLLFRTRAAAGSSTS